MTAGNGWGRGRLQRQQRHIDAETQDLEERLDALVALGRDTHQAHQFCVGTALGHNLDAIRAGAADDRPLEHRRWGDPAWSSWTPAQPGSTGGPKPTGIGVGEFRELRSGHLLGLAAVVGDGGAGRPIVVRSRAGQREAGNGLLVSMMVRMAVLVGGPTSYFLVDPVGRGRAFAWAAHLPGAVTVTGDGRCPLDAVMAEIDRRMVGRAGSAGPAGGGDEEDGDERFDETGAGPPPAVVAVADFPVGYDRRSVEWVRSLCRFAPVGGIHVLVHHRIDDGEPMHLGDAAVVDLANPPLRLGAAPVSSGIDVDIAFDDAPAVGVGRRVLEQVTGVDNELVRWDDLGHPAEDRWWSGDATERIVAPIGRRTAGAGRLQVTFGVDDEQRPCAHGVVVAMTGAGKTALFHNLIVGLTVRYSPEELALYLVDGKSGVGFAAYRGLPHAAVVSLRTRPDLARSVLDDLVEEMTRRNEIFKRHHVEHFSAYREVASPEGRLPRLLLVADEFQLLFEDDRDGRAARSLLRLSEQGRSAGIHLLLGSQHFAPAAMTNRNLIFANLHLRIALQMATADVRACVDFGPEGRRLIDATCTRSGRLVANDRAGDDAANQAATAAYLDNRRRSELLGTLRARRGPSPAQVVLDGDSQPQLLDDPLITLLCGADDWPDDAGLEGMARAERTAGGLGGADWLTPERPVALSLGQEFSVRGRAVAVLRRRRHEHLCV
ncbi:MAG: FtsK/SpoIIIE domain-containing protein, partial [Actinomycetota bacterium]|nr:FtsK/SpoIIIE domain-containing protein [Actinomycetota bacterium]